MDFNRSAKEIKRTTSNNVDKLKVVVKIGAEVTVFKIVEALRVSKRTVTDNNKIHRSSNVLIPKV
jgi:hypothetical protein